MADAAGNERSVSEELAKLMGKGKRHYICNEVEEAVKCFEEATQKLDKEYGQLANECGEAYLYYGKSLIDLARLETGVLGGVLKVGEDQNEDDSDDEEAAEDNQMETEDIPDKDKSVDEKNAEKTEEPTAVDSAEKKAGIEESSEKTGSSREPAGENVDVGENVENEAQQEKNDTAGTTGEEKQPTDTTSSDNKAEENGGPTEQETDDQPTEKVNGDVEEKEIPEEITTMELAWEILEMSRLTYERQETKEAKLNLGQTYLKLGEIHMERELFLEAVDEFHKCYQIQQKYLESDDRLLAETLYNVGLAYSIQSPPQYKESKEFYTKALDVIDLRIKNIEARLQEVDAKDKGKKKASDDDPCVKDRKELSELQDLYPEIKAKIDDAQEMLTSVSSKAEPIPSIAVKKPNGDIAKPATDISHLVKRKRKPEEPQASENTELDGPAKKPRQESSAENTNGHDIKS